MATKPSDNVYTLDSEPSTRKISDIDLNTADSGAVFKFVAAFAVVALTLA